MEEERKRILIEKETVFLLRENKIIKNIFPKGYDNIIQFTFNKKSSKLL